MSKAFYSIFISFLALQISACGQLKSANQNVESIDQRISADYNGPPEKAFCSGTKAISGPTLTVNGTAKFEYRPLIYTSSLKGLGEVLKDKDDNDLNPLPIRYAEVVILDNLDNVIQCGETDANGQFSLEIPSNGELYRVRVHSRGFNDSQYRASVMRSPESNHIYYLEKVISANQNHNLSLLAKATGDLKAGAFFILDQILKYNQKLRSMVGLCSGFVTGCTPFTTAPKVVIYWEKGFNPGVYLNGKPQSSFYYKGTNRLFLLGGVDGDVDYSDTDHFDESIIAHEYFHFLESTMGDSDSPGGSHNGNQIIDPRLAWSEGAAQFFQGIMTGRNKVIDTRGNLTGSTNLIVNFSIETATGSGGTDLPIDEHGGEYREFSVARLLWDAHDDTSGETFSTTACTAADISGVHDKCARDGFAYFWAVVTGANGFKNSSNAFISTSLLHKLHALNTGSSPVAHKNWAPLRNYELQAHNRAPDSQGRIAFGAKLGACASSESFSMLPPYHVNTNPTWYTSNLVTNNDFLHYVHSGGQLRLDLTVNFIAGLNGTLNFILYREDFFIGDKSTVIGFDTTASGTYPNVTYSIFTEEAIPAGNYMINVNLISASGNGSGYLNYSIAQNGGGGLCSVD